MRLPRFARENGRTAAERVKKTQNATEKREKKENTLKNCLTGFVNLRYNGEVIVGRTAVNAENVRKNIQEKHHEKNLST